MQGSRGVEKTASGFERKAEDNCDRNLCHASPRHTILQMQVCYWRYPTYNAVRFSFTLFFAFLLSTTFWRIGQYRWEWHLRAALCRRTPSISSALSLQWHVIAIHANSIGCQVCCKLGLSFAHCRSTEKEVLRIIASQYLAALILGAALRPF